METNKETNGFLDLLIRPGFCVKNQQITAVNQAAQCLLITPGTPVRQLLLTGEEEYAALRDGCLYLKLKLPSGDRGASVLTMEGADYFILDQEADNDALTAMALAARVLREPLTSMMLSLQQTTGADAQSAEQLARMNRGMHQMLRLLGNMSDAGRFAAPSPAELMDVPSVFGEIFDNAGAYVSRTGRTLRYTCDMPSLLSLLNRDLLERAVLNILSNAIKFSPPGSEIQARLTRQGRMLVLSIRNQGSGIAGTLRSTLFQRYLRQPGIEDGRFGLGLGMLLVRNAASAHGGTVLVDQPENTVTRITLTLAIRQETADTLRSTMIPIDYSGGLDHVLVELADCLPLELYENG